MEKRNKTTTGIGVKQLDFSILPAHPAPGYTSLRLQVERRLCGGIQVTSFIFALGVLTIFVFTVRAIIAVFRIYVHPLTNSAKLH